MSFPHHQYQKTAVTTASKEKVLLMLYEGAIRFVRQAQTAMKEKKVADKGRYISRATAILSELMATLDFKVGGKLASDLESLYIFMIDKLIESNVENKIEGLETVEKLLGTLHVAWKDVVQTPRPDGVPSPTLQPEAYASYLKQNGDQKVAGQSSASRSKGVPGSEGSESAKLKIVA